MKLPANLKHRRIYFVVVFILLLSIPATVYLAQKTQIFSPKAAFNFYGRELQVFKLFGQRSITETSRGQVSGDKVYHAAGVHVDRSSVPNKVYVVDSGNSRILGYNGIGYCSNDASQGCNVNSECGGNQCITDGSKNPDIVIGQPDLERASCNGDNNFGFEKNPSADSLCLMGFPYATNIAESWGRLNIDTDTEGNLYLPDYWNNRVLKYNQPFSSDKSDGKGDRIADFVWGQDDFSKNGRNKGPNFGPVTGPNNQSLWISVGPPDALSSRGVSVDGEGNLWVADIYNNRILRFRQGQKEADLVLGQPDFSSSGCAQGVNNRPMNRFCTPTLASVNPETGELYVLDEYPAPFRTRIMVFAPPFTDGMSAARIITPRQDGHFVNWRGWLDSYNESYIFQSTGFIFNTYKDGEYAGGELWINEHETMRSILVDREGNILKVISAKDKYNRGGDTQYGGWCGSIYDGFNLWWPGGSIGLDKDNNLYFADERFNRIVRYSLPYNTVTRGGQVCQPEPNGGLFPGTTFNRPANDKFGESVGVAVFQNQLIYQDEKALKVWNNYLNKDMFGASPDYIIRGGLKSRSLLSDAIDDLNRLWLTGENGQILVYQLPFTSSRQEPLSGFVNLYWQDDGTRVDYGGNGAFAWSGLQKKLYLTDPANHRILRISNYDQVNGRLAVDMVIGQPDKQTVKCNNNQDMPWLASGSPAANTLCLPYAVKFDRLDNLYVIENSYECHGNDRITVFMSEDLKNAQGLFPNISARKVFVAPDLTSPASCFYRTAVNEPKSPVSIAFDNQNRMVIGNDGYYDEPAVRQVRQLWFYDDPINKQTPDGYIDMPMGAPGEITFDPSDNLIVQDHTWSRIWVINPRVDTAWLNYLDGRTSPAPSVSPSLSPEPSFSPTPTPASSPVPGLIFEDDFSLRTSGWPEVSSSLGSTQYVNLIYRIYVDSLAPGYSGVAGLRDFGVNEWTAIFDMNMTSNSSSDDYEGGGIAFGGSYGQCYRGSNTKDCYIFHVRPGGVATLYYEALDGEISIIGRNIMERVNRNQFYRYRFDRTLTQLKVWRSSDGGNTWDSTASFTLDASQGNGSYGGFIYLKGPSAYTETEFDNFKLYRSGALPKPTTEPSPSPIVSPSPSSSPRVSPSPLPEVSPSPSPSLEPSPSSEPQSSPSPSPHRIGDVDGDNRVGVLDLTIVINNLDTSPPGDPRANLNNDNEVDIIDLGVVIDHFDL